MNSKPILKQKIPHRLKWVTMTEAVANAPQITRFSVTENLEEPSWTNLSHVECGIRKITILSNRPEYDYYRYRRSISDDSSHFSGSDWVPPPPPGVSPLKMFLDSMDATDAMQPVNKSKTISYYAYVNEEIRYINDEQYRARRPSKWLAHLRSSEGQSVVNSEQTVNITWTAEFDRLITEQIVDFPENIIRVPIGHYSLSNPSKVVSVEGNQAFVTDYVPGVKNYSLLPSDILPQCDY